MSDVCSTLYLRVFKRSLDVHGKNTYFPPHLKKKGLLLSPLRIDIPVFSCLQLAFAWKVFFMWWGKDTPVDFEIKILISNKYLSI